MASPDPRLVAAIRRQPAYLQVPLLTTALIESGGRLDAVGDNGQSFGPYQEYSQGRGAGIAPAQRMDPFASTARAAKEFATFYQRGARGASLAYRAQRPADQAGYMRRYNALQAQAQTILGEATTSPVEAPAPAGRRAGAPAQAPGGLQLTPESLGAIRRYARQSQADVLQGKAPASAVPVGELLRTTGFAPRQGARIAAAAVGGPVDGGPKMGVVGRAMGGAEKIIGTPFAGTHSLGNWESDRAVDIAAPVGTPIYALADGTIGSRFGSLGSGGRYAGLRLHLQAKGNEFYYAHLSRFAPGIKPGASVKRGQVIGYSGEANGVGHLHLGVRSGDPRSYFT